LQQLNLVNTYVLDPAHIAPSRSDANSNGHFPLPNNHHLNNGTPRGFSLQGMNMMNFGGNGMLSMQNMAAPFIGGMPGVSVPAGLEGGSQGGPVRRGGGARFNNRPTPYDRNGRNTNRGFGNMSNMMRTGMPGMNMGYIAQGGGGGGGKWGDGAGGAMNAIGPREAVQGRSIRSYEDLDAVPAGGSNGAGAAAAAAAAGGGAELDY
jgi:hypothetical protein